MHPRNLYEGDGRHSPDKPHQPTSVCLLNWTGSRVFQSLDGHLCFKGRKLTDAKITRDDLKMLKSQIIFRQCSLLFF